MEQWTRWKTGSYVNIAITMIGGKELFTFFNAVLLSLSIVVDLGGHTLDAVVVVVLSGGALLRLSAFYTI